MRWLYLFMTLFLVGCASSAKHDPQSLFYHGHCVKAQIGGQDFLADCTDTLVTLDYPSGTSAISFLLTGDRQVIFLLDKDPKVHPTSEAWITLSAALVTGSEEHDYQAVTIICSRSHEIGEPEYIQCIGQAEGKAAYFAFQLDGTAPIAGKSEPKNRTELN